MSDVPPAAAHARGSARWPQEQATPDVTRSAAATAPSGSRGAPATRPVANPACAIDAVACERCGTAMFRMHAVWRCPGCGFKTDCCGW